MTVPSSQSSLEVRAWWIGSAGWLIIILGASAAVLPLIERRGGALVIGLMLLLAGAAELGAGTLRHEAKRWAMLAGAVTMLAGGLFSTGPATRYFLPTVTIVMAWLALRSVILFLTSRHTGDGVRKWTLVASATDLLLALLLLVGMQIAALVVSLFGATAPLIASFSWILALSFVATGLMLLEVASCARGQDDI